MEGNISRRSFLKTSTVVLGAVAAFDPNTIVGAVQFAGLHSVSHKGIREETMPHVIVKLWPGRSEQQKVRLAEAIVRDVVEILGNGEESVSVAIEEIKPSDWREKVYKPDIIDKPKQLYKKPGYSM